MAEKKILIIGEAMLDKTIPVLDTKNYHRSSTTYKITKITESTFGGVFFISRYLQHFENIDITVININPTLTPKVKTDYDAFSQKFVAFPGKEIPSKCCTIEGSSDYIHSITRFMCDDDHEIYFQVEGYYAPNCRKNNNKIYTYSTAKKGKLWNELKSEIDGWIKDNQKYDKRILLMDYDLGLFEKEEGLLDQLEEYFNKKNNSPVIIYSGKDYTKFKGFKNTHIVIYSKDSYGNFIEPKDFFENIKDQSYCFCSIVLVSADSTCIRVFPLKKKSNIEEQQKKIPTEAWGCNHTNKRHIPRTGHKAIVAAHLAMELTTDANSLLNKRWLEYAHECSKEIANEILTENIINRDWKKDLENRKDTQKPGLPNY